MSKYEDMKKGAVPPQPSQRPCEGRRVEGELGYTPPQPAQTPNPTAKPQGGGDKK